MGYRFERGSLKMKLKKLFLPFAAVALAFSLAACGNDDKNKADQDTEENPVVDQEAIDKMNEKLAEQKVDEDIIVAVVNAEELDGERYNIVLQNIQVHYQQMGVDPTTEEMIEQIKTHTLDEMVNQALVLQQAKTQNIEVLAEDIDTEYGYLVEQFGNEEALEAALESENIDMETFRGQIADTILYGKYQEQIAPLEADISDDDIQAYYDEFASQSEGEVELPPLEDLSDDIKDILIESEQQKKFTAHLEELKKDATIELKI